MNISEAQPYEVLDEMELRVFQSIRSTPEGLAFSTPEAVDFFESAAESSIGGDPRRMNKPFRAELRLPNGDSVSCDLPEPPGRELLVAGDVRAYGEALFGWLFQEKIGEAFHNVRRFTQMSDKSIGFGGNLRLRLLLDPRSEKLHTLWWEALQDPGEDRPLSTAVAFSRFMRVKAGRRRPVTERPLRMLLVASNPGGLSRFDLTDINVDLERTILAQATERLSGLLAVDREVKPTVGRIYAAQAGNLYHIIHLLAHAVIRDGRGVAILADEKGKGQEVAFEEVVEALLSGAKEPPRVVFLATPLSGEEMAGQVLVSMAPLLVDAGVQAAVAIQSAISEDRLRRFCTRFYEALIKTGVVDVAMAAARAEIYDPGGWEWAYPVLYTSTPDARLFNVVPESLSRFKSAW